MSGVPIEFAGKFGDALKSARKSRGLLQIALANEIGVPNSYVSKWENGSMYPNIGQLNAIRRALELTDRDFDPLYFSWKREADAIPPAFMVRDQRPDELVAFVNQSIEFARQMRFIRPATNGDEPL